MTTVIVLVPITYGNGRKVCEDIEKKMFRDTTALRHSINEQLGIVDKLEGCKDMGEDDEDEEPTFFYELTDFMDLVNDDSLTEHFMSYVYLTE